MNKPAVIVLALSVLMILGSIIIFSLQEEMIDGFVEDNQIFQGTTGQVSVEKDNYYTVFVNSDYSCSDTTISISSGIYEYFQPDCDPFLDEKGWLHIGVFSSDMAGYMDVEANNEIAIVNDSAYAAYDNFLISGGLCCIGIIGIGVSIIIFLVVKPDETQQYY
tara:strand:- start:250 stop:738 length:489 start_codon:yes stop_codon:yes gene_type:complete